MMAFEKARKAQVSVELMVILALALIVLTAVVYMSQQNLGSGQATLRESQVRQAVQQLAAAADEVYFEGPGAKKRVYVTFPEGIDSISISGNVINFRLKTQDGTTDINAKANAPITGTLSTSARSEWIWVVANENGQVSIGASAVSISPSMVYASLYPTNTSLQNFTVTNLGDSPIAITVSVSPPSNSLVNITLLNSTTLAWLGSSTTFTLTANGGADYSNGYTLNISSKREALGSYYDGYVTANSSSESVRMDVSIEVNSLAGLGGIYTNVSSIAVQTFKDSARTIPKQVFSPRLNITASGSSWAASGSVTVNVTFPNGTLVSGYPQTVSTDGSGAFTHYVDATLFPSLTGYVIWTNQTGVTNSSTFDITTS